VDAKVITITQEGEVVWNVLSDKDSLALEVADSPGFEVREVANLSPKRNAKISLEKTESGVGLTILSNSGEETINLENTQTNIIEIEERPQVNKISIGADENDFLIRQGSVLARTSYPIEIDSESAALAVKTQTGEKYIYIMPKTAVDGLLRAKTVSVVNAEKEIRITEEEGILVYKVSGEKYLNLFNVYTYPVDVEASISTTTGEIVRTNTPIWLSVVSYLLS
jgi:hypothetical protein